MFHHPWLLDRHVRHQIAHLAADRRATIAPPGAGPGCASVRHRRGCLSRAIGVRLIMAGEWLAGGDAGRPAPRSVGWTARGGS